MSTTPTTDAVVHLRVRVEQLNHMREIARREDRSLSGQVRKALAEHIDRAGRDDGDET